MHKDNHQSPTAVAYAQALLDLAVEGNTAQIIGQELRDLRQVVDTTPQFAQVLGDPTISAEERGKLIRTVFTDRASHLLLNFLLLLNEKNRLPLLPGIAGAYDDLLDEQFGKVEVDVTVARELTTEQLDTVRQRVSTSLKRDAIVHQYVDPSIIGGLMMRVQDQLIDGSVKAQLDAMRRQLLSSRPA
ncbi:MAG: ATP synthase F1 subunit delta [Planctomycetota bacterium]|nr:ATP synthase F1 subunit delta [Planctomycetota bacterium]